MNPYYDSDCRDSDRYDLNQLIDEAEDRGDTETAEALIEILNRT